MPNDCIIRSLAEIAEVYQSQGVVYKCKAYRTAIDVIKALPFEISSVTQLKGQRGLGKAMIEKIDEILRTGALEQAQKLASDPTNAAQRLFTSVHGIGPVLAKQLVDQGYRTLEDLKDAHLPPTVRMGLAHMDAGRIPFAEVEQHLAFIRSVLTADVDSALVAVVCGSHRRLVPTSGDIDVLLTHPLAHSLSGEDYLFLARSLQALRSKGYIVDTLAEGPTKFMGYAKLPELSLSSSPDSDAPPSAGVPARRLDVRWVPLDHFHTALLYFTGCDTFNVRLRTHALRMGYTLNEYSLRATQTSSGAVVPAASEKEIFDALALPYVKPVDRSK